MSPSSSGDSSSAVMRAERGRRLIERDRVGRPDLAHDRDLRRIELTCEIAADRRPRVATVVAAIDAFAGEVETPRRNAG